MMSSEKILLVDDKPEVREGRPPGGQQLARWL
jgi:hypothetical protein